MARRILLLLTTTVALCLAAPAWAIIDVTLQMQLGNPSGAIADTNNHDHYLIQRPVEAIDYNDYLGLPNWVSWDLTSSDMGSAPRSPDFFTDTNLPATFYWVLPTDYSGSGYDRGHMCPSADRTDNTTDNDMVFYMSNIIPQAPEVNQIVWVNFEDYCRTLADSGYELLIMCGPSGFYGGSRILPSQAVAVPAYNWKIAVVVPLGAGTALSRITETTRVIALRIPNTNGVSSVWQNFVTSANQIQADTGLTFFTALPPTTAAVLRGKIDGQTASPPGITGFSPSSGAVNSTVTITGTNFNSATAVTFYLGVPAAFSVDSDTQITATVPTNATAGPISVTRPGGTAISSNSFTVTDSTADLSIGKSHTGNFTQGDVADTYVITITNIGQVATSGTVSVVDALPAGLTATAISGFGWTVDLPALTCTRNDPLMAGAGYPPILVTVSVAANAATAVTNVATVTGGGDVSPANNTASDPTTILISGGGGGSTLLAWDVHYLVGGTDSFGVTPYAPTTKDANLTSVGLVRGSGVGTTGTAAYRAWGGNAFTGASAAAAIAANQVITFSASVASGYTVSYSSISRFDYRRSSTGPATGLLQYQVGSGPFTDITDLLYPSTSSGGDSLAPINLSGITDLQNVGAGTNVTFRIVNYGGGSSGTWYVFDVANSTAPDLALQGTVSPVVYLTPIEAWRLQWFGITNNSGIAADTTIVTSDGMPNLLKYALDLNPLVPTNSPVVGDVTTGHLRLTAPKNPDATDITFLVELADDAASAWTTNGTTIDQNTSALLQVHENTSVNSSAGGYMRLHITRP